MKRLVIFLPLLFSGFSFIKAQCLQIESILVDACVNGVSGACTNSVSPTCNCEGKNEMVIFKVGSSALNVSSLSVAWPNNSFRGWYTPDAVSAANISALNATIVKCGYLKEPVGGVIPANSEVLIVGSIDMCTTANSFANLQDTLIVLFQNAGNYQGHFANTTNGATITSSPSGASSIRSMTLSYPPLTCSETVSYDRSLMVNIFGTYGGTTGQNDGSTIQFDASGNATYVNYGCQAPYIPIIVQTAPGSNVCFNGTTNISGTVSGPYTSYTWSGGTGTFGNASSLNTTYSPGSGDADTVTLYLTAQGKCAANVVKDSVVLAITPAPTPTVTSSVGPAVCAGTSVVLSVNTEANTTYSWSPGSGSASSFTVSPAVQTVYTVAATNSCTTTYATFTVNVNSLPVINVVNDSVCPGATATLSASGASTYTWSNGSNGSSMSDNPASTTPYTVSGTDGNGCVNSATGEIFIYTPPTISVTSASVCPGGTATLTASGASTYTWSSGASGSSMSDNPASTTQYTATGTDIHGCNNTGTGEIFIYTPVLITTNSPSVCPGATATLTAGGASTYTWSTTQNGASISVTPSVTTTYTVSATDANGCDNSATATVSIYSLPVVGVNSPNVCPGNPAVLNASGAVTYTWSTGSTASTITVTPGFSTSSYTVTGTDANGCVNDTVATVSIVNTLTVTATTANSTVCSGSPTTLTGNGAGTYTWSPASSLNSATGGSVIASPTVNTTYTVIGSSGNCSDTNVVTVNVNPLPAITANSATICAAQQTATLTANGASTYSWSPSTGLNTSTGSQVLANPPATSTYVVTGTDNNSCQNTATVVVTVNPPPNISINSSPVCAGATATLTASGASTYTWSTSQTTSTISISPGTSTSYTVIGTDAGGCINTAVTTVTINPLPTVTVNSPAVCANASATLIAGGASTYTWSGGQTGGTLSVPGTAASYTVTGTDVNGCQGTAVSNVSVLPLPAPQSVTGNTVICSGQTEVLSVAAPGTYSYSWSGPGGFTGSGVSVPVTQGGVYTLTTTNGCGSITTQFTVAVSTPQAGFTPSTVSAQVPATFVFTNSSSGTQLSNYWNFSNGDTSIQTSPSETYTASGTYTITLVVIDQFGCPDTARHTVLVTEVPVPVVIPNIFTPNGDNINDIFMVSGKNVNDFNCKIYDRWGLMMYEWNGINGGWDGQNSKNGAIASDGTYYYIISYTDGAGTQSTKRGYLQLMR